MDSAFYPPFSGNKRVFSGSNTEFNLSSTESSARDISSIKNNKPLSIASTRGPSFHSNKASYYTKTLLILSKLRLDSYFFIFNKVLSRVFWPLINSWMQF